MSLDISLRIEVDTGGDRPHSVQLWENNATHNLLPMWRKAGVYEALYESHGKLAGEFVEFLEKGLADMKAGREEYLPLNPSNGWGDYDGAVQFLESALNAFKSHPKAIVHVWA